MSKRQVIQGPSVALKLKMHPIQPAAPAPTPCPECPECPPGCTENVVLLGWWYTDGTWSTDDYEY